MRIKSFRLEEYFAKYEFNVEYSLCSSDCESFTINELLSMDSSSSVNFKDVWLGYTESLGHPVLREEISKLYSCINLDEIIVFSGAEEAIFIFMNVLGFRYYPLLMRNNPYLTDINYFFRFFDYGKR